MNNIIPINHTIWAVYGDDDEILKGNLRYFKWKVLAVNIDRVDEYLIASRDCIEMEDCTDLSNFIGFYEDHEIDTEDFICDLEVYAHKLEGGK